MWIFIHKISFIVSQRGFSGTSTVSSVHVIYFFWVYLLGDSCPFSSMHWARAWYNKLSRTHSSSWMLECDARKCGGKWNPPFLSVYDEFLILCRGSFHCDGKFCSTYVGILLTTKVSLSETSYSNRSLVVFIALALQLQLNACTSHQKEKRNM